MSKSKRMAKPQPDLIEQPEIIPATLETIEEEPNLQPALVLPVQASRIIEPEVIAPRGQLIAHCGTTKITLEELKLIPTPAATRTHKPVAHYTIVESLLEALSYRHITCVRSEFAVSPDGMRCFGVLDLDAEFNGCRFSIGMRNGNDKSLRLAMTVGFRCVVCDNMAFYGDFTPVLAKHSRNLQLTDSISIGVDKMQRNFEPLKRQIDRWKQEYLQDNEARLILYNAFLDGKLKAPLALMPKVHDYYFNPQYEEFKEKNLWSLSNAFTSAFKQLVPIRQFQVTAKLGGFMEQFVMPY